MFADKRLTCINYLMISRNTTRTTSDNYQSRCSFNQVKQIILLLIHFQRTSSICNASGQRYLCKKLSLLWKKVINKETTIEILKGLHLQYSISHLVMVFISATGISETKLHRLKIDQGTYAMSISIPSFNDFSRILCLASSRFNWLLF